MTAWLIKMAWRDSRNHRRKLLLFTSSITIGIGALAGMGSLSMRTRAEAGVAICRQSFPKLSE